MPRSVSESEPKQLVSTNANANTPITQEPKASSMTMSPEAEEEDDGHTIQTVTDNASGYQRDTNECTEFCIDLFNCFGACDACCPSTGEGCLSTTAAFIGNICVGCIKC